MSENFKTWAMFYRNVKVRYEKNKTKKNLITLLDTAMKLDKIAGGMTLKQFIEKV